MGKLNLFEKVIDSRTGKTVEVIHAGNHFNPVPEGSYIIKKEGQWWNTEQVKGDNLLRIEKK